MKILIAEDHRMMADGLANLFSKRPDLQVVATAEDGQQAVTMASKYKPELIIMDVNLPVLGGIEATRQIKTMFNEAPLGIALIDSLTGNFCEVNSMFGKIAGRTMEEMTSIN